MVALGMDCEPEMNPEVAPGKQRWNYYPESVLDPDITSRGLP